MISKFIERDRYDKRSIEKLNSNLIFEDQPNGPIIYPKPIRKPYEEYQNLTRKTLRSLNQKHKILELCSGTGEFTSELIKSKAKLYATDISKYSLKILSKRFSNSSNLQTIECDIEDIPFKEEYFDAIFCAGSLSYGDNKIVLDQIFRVLKKNGKFICIDSFNENPIYVLHRLVNIIRGRRTFATLKRIPNFKLLKKYKSKFKTLKVNYYGKISWLYPLLVPLIGVRSFCKLSEHIDSLNFFKYLSFKIIIEATKG